MSDTPETVLLVSNLLVQQAIEAFDSYDKDNVFEGTFTASLRTPKHALWEVVEKITGETYEHS